MSDIQISPPITGTLEYTVLDPRLAPSNIIHLGDGWQIKAHWELNGDGVNMLAGVWVLRFYVESIGQLPPQDEFMLFDEKVNFTEATTITPSKLVYERDFPPIGGFFPHPVTKEGVYKPVLVLTCLDQNGLPGPFAGFAEGDLLQFYP